MGGDFPTIGTIVANLSGSYGAIHAFIIAFNLLLALVLAGVAVKWIVDVNRDGAHGRHGILHIVMMLLAAGMLARTAVGMMVVPRTMFNVHETLNFMQGTGVVQAAGGIGSDTLTALRGALGAIQLFGLYLFTSAWLTLAGIGERGGGVSDAAKFKSGALRLVGSAAALNPLLVAKIVVSTLGLKPVAGEILDALEGT